MGPTTGEATVLAEERTSGALVATGSVSSCVDFDVCSGTPMLTSALTDGVMSGEPVSAKIRCILGKYVLLFTNIYSAEMAMLNIQNKNMTSIPVRTQT